MADVTEGEKMVPGVMSVDGVWVKVASVAVVDAVDTTVDEEVLANGLVWRGGIWMCISPGLWRFAGSGAEWATCEGQGGGGGPMEDVGGLVGESALSCVDSGAVG